MVVRRQIPQTHPPAGLLALSAAPRAALASAGALEFARAIMARYGRAVAWYRAVRLLHLIGPAGVALPGAVSIRRWLALAVVIDRGPTVMRPAAGDSEARRPWAQPTRALACPSDIVVGLVESVKYRLVRETRWREVLHVSRSSATAQVPATALWPMHFGAALTTPNAAPIVLAKHTGARDSEIIVGWTGLAGITQRAPLRAQDAGADARGFRRTASPAGFIRLPVLTVDADCYRTPAKAGSLEHPALTLPGSRASFLVGSGVGQADVEGQRTASRALLWGTLGSTLIRTASGGTDVRTGVAATRGAARELDIDTLSRAILLNASHRAALSSRERLRAGPFTKSSADTDRTMPAPTRPLDARATGRWPSAVPAGQASVAPGLRADAHTGRVATHRRTRQLPAPPHLALTHPAADRGPTPRGTVPIGPTTEEARHATGTRDLGWQAVGPTVQPFDFLRVVRPASAMAGADSDRAILPHLITVLGYAPWRIVRAPSDEPLADDSAGAVLSRQLGRRATALALRGSPRAPDRPPADHPLDEGIGSVTDTIGPRGHPEPFALPVRWEGSSASGNRKHAQRKGLEPHGFRAMPGLHPGKGLAPFPRADHLHWLDLRGPSEVLPAPRPGTAFRRYRGKPPVHAGPKGLFDIGRQAGRRSLLITLLGETALMAPSAAAIPRARALRGIQPLAEIQPLALGSRVSDFGALPATPVVRTHEPGKLPDQAFVWGPAVGAPALIPAAPPGRLGPQPASPPPPRGVQPVSAGSGPGGIAEVVRLQQPSSRTLDFPKLADAVYRLIVDRVRREKHMRGL